MQNEAMSERAEKRRRGELLLVIPAYNERENLPDVISDILLSGEGIDYIVVSDGSTDGTAELCRERGWNYIELPVNLGLAGCFQTGMKYALREGYSYAAQFDGDGQHRAEDVRLLLEKMKEGEYDIVLGSRFLQKKRGGSMRELGSRLISLAIFLSTGKKLTDPTCGLRLYRKTVIEDFALRLNYGPEPDTISYLIRRGCRIAEVAVEVRERRAGESYLRPLNAAKYMARMLISILLIQYFRGGREDGRTGKG